MAMIALAIVLLLVGSWIYQTNAPKGVDIVGMELGDPHAWSSIDAAVKTRHAIAWDFVFIPCYGLALILGTAQARWLFWTPKAAAVADVGRQAAWTVIIADMVENLLLLRAVDDPLRPDSWWAQGAAAAATIKWAALIPAASVAVLGILVALGRCGNSLRPRNCWTIKDSDLRVQRQRESPLPADTASRTPILRALFPFGFVRWQEPESVGSSAGAAQNECRYSANNVDKDLSGPRSDTPQREKERRWISAFNVPSVTHEELQARRGDSPVIGVSLSGGGIRSGSLAFGVLDSLRSELLKASYLVSISGGGYTAGAFAQLLTAATPPPSGRLRLPSAPRLNRDPATAYRAGTTELDYVRRHSSYIAATASDVVVACGVLARGMLATLVLVYGPAIVLGTAAAMYFHAIPINTLSTLSGLGGQPLVPNRIWLAVTVTAALALTCWLLQLVLYNFEAEPNRWGYDLMRGASLFFTQATLVVVAIGVGIPALAWIAWRAGTVVDQGIPFGVGASIGSVLVTYLAGLASIAWRQRATISKAIGPLGNKGPSAKAAVPAGLLQLLLVILAVVVVGITWLLLVGVCLITTSSQLVDQASDSPPLSVYAVGLGAAAVVLVLGSLFDETSLSLHPFYRRRLAGAFATRSAFVEAATGEAQAVAVPYEPSERTTLSAYARLKPTTPFPDFIFAAAANLTGERRTPPGRTATSFVLSADWMGGPDVGWVKTCEVERVSPFRLRRDLTVQAAVAISGAAFASAMGRAARWYQLILALTGARLGAWLPNPCFLNTSRRGRKEDGSIGDWTLPGSPSVRRITYLLREILNIHPIEERLLQITDGGHYENLGIVELLRRRCTLIYCVDGGGDRPPTAQGLAHAIALAQTELGVKIDLDHPLTAEPGSASLPDATPSLAPLAARLSQEPVINGTITYPEASGLPADCRTGKLVVGRALLWPSLPYWLLSYAVTSPVFPHDATGDQFFSDDQFTAYTELGREVGKVMAGCTH